MNIQSDRLIEHFLSLIQIDSESGNEKVMAEQLQAQLSALGFEVTPQAVDPALSNGFNLYAKLPGTLPGHTVMSCHMDTVTPGNGIEPEIVDGMIRSKGNTILGGDDKSGIAAIMEAVRSLQEQGIAHHTIELAFTVYEEGGLCGSKCFDVSMIEAKQGVVLDSGGPIGTIITQAPGQQNIELEMIGRPAHAGLAPEDGINALTVVADAISQMKLSRIDHETTANIGVVQGGQATNIVMPSLTLKAEARSLDDAKLEAQVAHMVQTFEQAAAKHGATANIKVSPAYGAYRISDDDPLVQLVSQAFGAVNLPAKTSTTGGGSDANIFNQKGIKMVNLSTGMSKVHTCEEFIAVQDMIDITRALTAYMAAPGL
ncbi:Peptidase T [Vibrio stylophorae]|uniref:Peptidase T n=1 Tax=Vibrio stylophorae TaxID=659351 RepID=A0ABM8ZS06_9VIBR|nr:M20/M25/M40 family metallo-hydrolase [Vibrio stylophorae]CAH0533079.1 Peptidase T [Vibrio stylophorae]